MHLGWNSPLKWFMMCWTQNTLFAFLLTTGNPPTWEKPNLTIFLMTGWPRMQSRTYTLPERVSVVAERDRSVTFTQLWALFALSQTAQHVVWPTCHCNDIFFQFLSSSTNTAWHLTLPGVRLLLEPIIWGEKKGVHQMTHIREGIRRLCL